MGVKGYWSLKQIVTMAAALAVIAMAALFSYRVLYGTRASYPALEAATAITALRPIALPDYTPIYAVRVHYEARGTSYVLMPGPSPLGCSMCIPPEGWLYSVSLGANASPVYGAYYTAENNTLLVGSAAVIPPYFSNGTLYYVYPTCSGGYKISETSISMNSSPLPVVVILLKCS